MNWAEDDVDEVPAVVVTVTYTVPVPAGEVAVSDVVLPKVTAVAATVPKSTVAPLTNPVPVMVTMVPPVARWSG